MKKFNIDFYKNKKIYFALSIAVLVVGLICTIVIGPKLDLQFCGRRDDPLRSRRRSRFE